MGLEMVLPSARLVWVAEIDPAASKLLEARHPGVPNLGDIKAVDWSTVEKVDVLTAGYPCQPFSDAGRRLGEEDTRDVTGDVAEAIRILRPRLAILENVSGHLRRGFSRVLGSLASMGYVARWHSVRAAEAGAPHRRERLFCLAYPADDGQQRPWDSR